MKDVTLNAINITFTGQRSSSLAEGKLKRFTINMKNKEQAGVWLDNNHAMVISNSTENAEYSITGKVKGAENFGSGSEHAMNNSRQGDTIKFFKTLSAQLLAFDEILLFGPGKSQEKFKNHLEGDAQFKNKKISIDSSDNLTDPQKIAMVREFFGS